MNSEILQKYTVKSKQLTHRLEKDPGALQELLHLIECGKDESNESPPLVEFFKGEYAFYSGRHEVALKHYLEAKGIEHLQFYCFRSSSHIYKKQGEIEKALTYVKQALEIFPDDPPSIQLQNELVKNGMQPSALNDEKSVSHALKKPAMSFMVESEKAKSGSQALETSLKELYEFQSRQIYHYLEFYKSRAHLPDHCLYLLHGWDEPPLPATEHGLKTPSLAMLTEEMRKTSGGFYIRWNGTGIVINPGKDFIKHFHAAGLSIYDIHFIIASHEDPESYSDIQEIYDLTYQLNRTGQNLHVIHYYLNLKAYQMLSGFLKPHFKQERHSVHCLELFLDSSEIEKIDLCPGIRMHYFPAGVPAVVPAGLSREKTAALSNALGLRLELFTQENAGREEGASYLTLGYASGVSWSPLLGHHLAACDLLIAGLGNTGGMDYERTSYMDRELGYFGIFSLMEELMPKLLICSEFGGREGDIRLEVVRKLKNDLYENFLKNDLKIDADISETGTWGTPALLPGDIGLYIDLKSLKIRCSETGAIVDPTKIKVVRSKGRFSRLLYLSEECCLD